MEYKEENIRRTYFGVLILDEYDNVVEEVFNDDLHRPLVDVKQCVCYIIRMKKHDKELGKEYGVWSYRLCIHEEDDDTDWQTIYKVSVRKNKYYLRVDEDFC